MSVDQQFNRINEKLQLLLKQHNRVQKENERLKDELEKAKSYQAGQLTELEGLKQQVAILKLAAGEMSESDKKEFEKKINQYLKQLDRCIAFLGE